LENNINSLFSGMLSLAWKYFKYQKGVRELLLISFWFFFYIFADEGVKAYSEMFSTEGWGFGSVTQRCLWMRGNGASAASPPAPGTLAAGLRPLPPADSGQEELACSSRPAGSKAQAGGLFMLPLTRPAAQSRIAKKTLEQRH